MNKHLYLVDGSGYIFRAYYAMPSLNRKEDGLPIGAVAGFCNMLYKLLCDIKNSDIEDKPTHVAIIFDHSRSEARTAIYPKYKSNRVNPPLDLSVQFSIIRKAVEAFNVAMVEKPGVEADDIIATYARKASDEGARVTIISSDKDLMQLVDDKIVLYDPMKDKRIEAKDVEEKWGVLPSQMVDFQAMVGDTSDNVPGINGVGPKTAANLLKQYGSLEGVYDNINILSSQSLRKKLRAYKDNAFLSKKLVTLQQDVDLCEAWDNFELIPWYDASLVAFLKALGMKSLLKRISISEDIDVAAIEPVDLGVDWQQISNKKIVNTKSRDIRDLNEDFVYQTPLQMVHILGLRFLPKMKIINTDEELANLRNVLLEKSSCGLYIIENYIYVSCAGNEFYRVDLNKYKNETYKLLCNESINKVVYDSKSFIAYIEQFLGKDISVVNYSDIRLMAFNLDNELDYSLDNLINLYIKKKVEDTEKKAASIFRLYNILKGFLIDKSQLANYLTIDQPLIGILHKMEKTGIKVDVNLLKEISDYCAKKIDELKSEIFTLAESEFNIGSPNQLAKVLFDQLGFESVKKTKQGKQSTEGLVLEELASQGHLLPEKILEWRHLTKLKNTYCDVLPDYVDENARIHTSYLLGEINTGRISSRNPNLQNIPISSDIGKRIRTAFVADEGNVLISADYNQIELRLLAEIADVKGLKEAFKYGHDVHAITASRIFNKDIKEIDGDLRRKAKAVNFGIVYGISPYGLSRQLNIPATEAKNYIDRYLMEFPEIYNYINDTKDFVRDTGVVNTITGRSIHYSSLPLSKGARKANLERAAVNAITQGSAADIIKLAMVKLSEAFETSQLPIKMLMQVHDELIFEAPENYSQTAMDLIKKNMEVIEINNGAKIFNLEVNVSAGKNWGEAHS